MKNKLMSNKAVKITLVLIALALIFTIGFTQEESVFAASDVAEINGVGYSSLYSAVYNSKEGDTITLLQDTTETNSIPVTKSITIDLNGKTVTSSSSANAAVLINTSGVDVEIKNGTIQTSAVSKTVWINAGNSLTLNDLTVKNTYASYNSDTQTTSIGMAVYTSNSSASLTINDCDVSSYGSAIYISAASSADISGGEINSTYSNGVYIIGTATVDISGAEINSTSSHGIYAGGTSSVDITDCTITAKYYCVYNASASDVDIYGCTLTADSYSVLLYSSTTEQCDIIDSIISGSYAVYVYPGSVMPVNISGCNITGDDFGIIFYGTNVSNIEDTVVTADSTPIIITNASELTISDGTQLLIAEDSQDSSAYGLLISGTQTGSPIVTVEDGAVIDAYYAIIIGGAYSSGTNFDTVADNTIPKLYINGGTIGGEDCMNAVIGNGLQDNTYIEINGGTLIGGLNMAISHPQTGDLIINGGYIAGPTGIQYGGNGLLKITGGTIVGTEEDEITIYKDSADGDGAVYESGTALLLASRGGGYQDGGQTMVVEISGGTLESVNNDVFMVARLAKEDGDWVFDASVTTVPNYLESLTITGGTFIGDTISVEPLAAAEGVINISAEAYENSATLQSYFEDYTKIISSEDGSYTMITATLQEAITFAEAGDTIVLCDDITISEQIKIAKDVTIISADGKNCTITSNVYNSFSIAEGINFNLDSLNFVINNNLIWANKENDIKITNCTFEMTTGGYIIGSGNSQDATEIATEYSDLIFTGNTVTGAINKLFIIRPNGTTTISGNTITAGEGSAEKSTIGAIVGYTGASINITNNTITGLYRVVCIDNTTETVSWNISSNKFIDCDNVLNYDSDKDANAISIAYNFNGETADSAGTLGGLMDEQEIADESVITRYPYYADSALTTLVYEGGEEKSNEDVVADLDATTDLETAVETLVSIDSTTLASSSEMIDKVNEVDTAFVSENENISSEAKIAETDLEEEESIQSAEVSGLALSALGGTDVSESTTVYIEITQQDASEEDADIVLSIKPYVQVDGGDATLIENSSLDTPVTITIELPAGFDSSYVNIEHISDDGTITNYDNLKVSDNKVTFTVTHFSTFNITKVETTSSSSSSSNITISSEYTGGNTYSAEEETVEPEEDTSEETIAPTVTETPVVTEKPSTAETANTSNGYIAWIIIAVLAIAIVGFIIYKKKANK